MTDPGRHFCTCKDLACPCNPNNPKNLAKGGLGCDACIRKNLARGEVPSCMFISLGDTSEWDDWSVEGFARFVSLHPRSEEGGRSSAEHSAAFEAARKN